MKDSNTDMASVKRFYTQLYNQTYNQCFTLNRTYKSKGAPWPRWQSVFVGGRIVAACLTDPGPQDLPDAGSLSAQTVPSVSCSACRYKCNKWWCLRGRMW